MRHPSRRNASNGTAQMDAAFQALCFMLFIDNSWGTWIGTNGFVSVYWQSRYGRNLFEHNVFHLTTVCFFFKMFAFIVWLLLSKSSCSVSPPEIDMKNKNGTKEGVLLVCACLFLEEGKYWTHTDWSGHTVEWNLISIDGFMEIIMLIYAVVSDGVTIVLEFH